MKSLREVLEEAYLEYLNNYLTVDVFAEHNNISHETALNIIDMGRKIHNENTVETNNVDDFS